ncbi:MAG TPA: hypothetical protein VIG33_13140 [Pseudobdellovibrionaceae bacterium]|jgi:hypothetical protein
MGLNNPLNPIKLLWRKMWIPDLTTEPQTWEDKTFQDQIPNVRRVETENSDILVPDPKAVRSMSRASLFMSSMAEEMKPFLAPYLEKSPFSVGIYCAVENGPIDGPSTAEILNRSTEAFDFKFAEAYRKLRNPKMYLKQLPNLAPAQLGISLGIQGPMNVYTHSLYACQQALEQAEADLLNKKVEAALVLTAHAFDDFWVVKRSRHQEKRTLCEGAATLILSLSEGSVSESAPEVMKKSANREYYFDAKNYFGISDPLINLLRKWD